MKPQKTADCGTLLLNLAAVLALVLFALKAGAR